MAFQRISSRYRQCCCWAKPDDNGTTRIAVDEANGRIEFYVNGKNVASLNERGLIVNGPVQGTALDVIPEQLPAPVQIGAPCAEAGAFARDTDGDMAVCADNQTTDGQQEAAHEHE